MRAMILAAGFGTRLLPATKLIPKPCFPVLNRPIIMHIIDNLTAAGITEIVINLHHLPELLKETVARFKDDRVTVRFSYEGEILGTGGGIKNVEELLQGEPFVLHNGDIFTRVDLAAAIEFHRSKKSSATMIVKKGDHKAFIGLDDNSRIVRFPYGDLALSENYTQKTYFTGIHILEPAIFDYIPPDVFYGINARVYPDMLKEGHKAYGYVTDAYWQDIGTPADFLQVNRDMLDPTEPPLIGDRVVIDGDCEIGQYTIIGDGCRISLGASIDNSVLFENVVVREGERITGSIVLPGLVVPVNGKGV